MHDVRIKVDCYDWWVICELNMKKILPIQIPV